MGALETGCSDTRERTGAPHNATPCAGAAAYKPSDPLPSLSRFKRPLTRGALLAGVSLGVLALLALHPARAVDGTWTATSGDLLWNNGANWSSNPNVPDNTATFTNNGALFEAFITADVSINQIEFTAGAPSYFVEVNTNSLSINGIGIINNSSSTQTLTSVNSSISFNNASTAGNITIIIPFINVAGFVGFFDTSTAGSATIANNGHLEFSNSSTAGNAKITNHAGSLLSFGDTSTAGSAIISNGGVLSFSGNSTAQNASITNTAGGSISFSTISFSDTSSAGSATITNPVTDGATNVQFGDASTASNATIINFSGLAFSDSSTAGSATIDNAGNLSFNDTTTAGTATITNSNSLSFSGNSTAGTANITTGLFGTAQFGDTSTAGGATITNNGDLNFADASTAGNATIINTLNLNFTDNASAGSATIINNRVTPNISVCFSGTSTAGNATIITNNGIVFFQDNASGGTARFITNNSGSFDISGLSSSATTAGSIEGTGSYSLGSKTLIVGGNNLSSGVSGVIQDGGLLGGTGGSLVKEGTGTLILSGANTYTGTTTVNAGTLIVDGSIASSSTTMVNRGATIAGNGVVGNTTINGGTLAPGTLTVQGSLVMTAAAIYLVEVSPDFAASTKVTGAATLGGTVLAAFQPGSYVLNNYRILTSAGLGGTTFDGLTTVNLPIGFTAKLRYTASDVALRLTAALGAGTGFHRNRQGVAGAINNFFNSGGALPPNFVGLFDLTGAHLADALARLSGEAAAGAQHGAFQFMGQFLGLMLDPFVDGRTGSAFGAPAIAFAPEREAVPEHIAHARAEVTKALVTKAPPAGVEPRWTGWGAAFGGRYNTDGDPVVAGSRDLSARTAGFAGGLDYRVTPDTVLGFALAGGAIKWSVAEGLGGGESDTIQAGVYGATRAGPAYLAAAFAYAAHDMSTERLAFAGNRHTADFDAHSVGGRLEGGYRFATALGGVTPYAAVQAQSFRTPSYREIDVSGGGFALAFDERTASHTRSELGARFDRVLALDAGMLLALRGRLAWAHDWVSDPALRPVFQSLPGAGFIVNAAAPAEDSALVSAGAELRLANGVTLAAKFDGEFTSRSSTYAGTGTLRVSW